MFVFSYAHSEHSDDRNVQQKAVTSIDYLLVFEMFYPNEKHYDCPYDSDACEYHQLFLVY